MKSSRLTVWIRLIITSLVVTATVYAAHKAHLLEGAELWWLDMMAVVDHREFDAPVAVVAITDDDYHAPEHFGGISPLHPGVLHHLLKRVVEHNPRGVVLDIQLHPTVSESKERSRARLELYRTVERLASSTDMPIVLVRNLNAETIERVADTDAWAEWDRLVSESSAFWGDPSLVPERGRIREIPLRGESRHSASAGEDSQYTILGACIRAFDLEHESHGSVLAEHEHDSEPWVVRFTGTFLDPAKEVGKRQASAGALLDTPFTAGQRSFLRDQIVFIGGAYYAGRDLHPTVLGPMFGVHVWAEAVASWMRNDALREPKKYLVLGLEFFVGVLTGLALVRFGPLGGMVLCLLIIGPLTVFFSVLTFGQTVLFVNFLPAAFGVYLHYQLELHLEIRHLKQKLRLVA